ncbi:MAG: hypothetical protein AB7H77_06045, partial [Bdellovibrionales bacterium]
IQWVTVHTGLPFSEHRVFDLGDAHKLVAPRIWDLAMDAGKKVWICGSMNAAIRSKNAAGRGYFIPDPWCTGAPAAPKGMFDTFHTLTSRYVQEHTRSQAPWSKKDYLDFVLFMVRNGLSPRTLWEIFVQLAREVRSKGVKWRRATLLDRFQWDLFRHTWKKIRPDFSTFFLNSTAHFQHYHWREFEPQLFASRPGMMKPEAKDAIRIGYQNMDRIVQECMDMAPDATIVLMTALSQQPLLKYETVGGKFIFKPVDHRKLMQFAGVDAPYRFEPVMAEEYRLVFDDEATAAEAAGKLTALTLDGKPLLRARQQGREIFGGCDVFLQPEDGAMIRSSATNRTGLFHDYFYQVDGVKSGGHHPDGIFWIRKPGAPAGEKGKIPLLQAAEMLAGMIGVRFTRKSSDAALKVAS